MALFPAQSISDGPFSAPSDGPFSAPEVETRGGEGGAPSEMQSLVADGHATRRTTTSERHIMILRKRDARQEVAKAVEKMLGVRGAQVGSAYDLLKLDSLVDLIGRDSEESPEVACQTGNARSRRVLN